MDRVSALRDTLGACYRTLNIASFQAVTPGGLHHGQAPEGTVLDYAVIEGPAAEQWDSMQNPGEGIEFLLAGLTLNPDYGTALAIVQAGVALLDGARPTVNASHICVQCVWRRTQSPFQPPELVNGKVAWKVVATFALLIDQIS